MPYVSFDVTTGHIFYEWSVTNQETWYMLFSFHKIFLKVKLIRVLEQLLIERAGRLWYQYWLVGAFINSSMPFFSTILCSSFSSLEYFSGLFVFLTKSWCLKIKSLSICLCYFRWPSKVRGVWFSYSKIWRFIDFQALNPRFVFALD